MRTHSIRRVLLIAGLFAGVLTLAAPELRADALDAAKAAGQVGERYDGYLGAVGGDDASKTLATNINAKRKAYYAKIAAGEGTSVEAVAAIAGAKLVKGAPSGQYVMPSADSGWKRVP